MLLNQLTRLFKATATLALIALVATPALAVPLSFNATATSMDHSHPHYNPIDSPFNNSMNLQARDGPRKRMLSWDAMNSLHDTGNLDYINQIDWRLIPSYHNWHGWHPADMWIKGQEHVNDHVVQRKIIHDESELYGDTWNQVWNSNVPIIGYFNEPERTGMTPERAAELWTEKMVPLRTQQGKQLISPGCADSGLDWCDRFIEIVTAKGQAPDYQAVHFYAAGEGSSEAAIAYLESRHAKHPSMDIFVLEIASIDRNQDEVFKFTTRVTNWMDQTAWIKEYAWFGFMPNLADGFVSPAAQLMDSAGSLTALGRKLLTQQPMQ